MLFSRAISDTFRSEVPQYGPLTELVSDVNVREISSQLPTAAPL